jgi:hypothetical protein
MSVHLPDLGPNFTAILHLAGTTARAMQGTITVTPGVWLLTRPKVKAVCSAGYDLEFVAPPERLGLKPAVWHNPAPDWVTGKDLPVHLTAAVPDSPEVRLQYKLQSNAPWHELPMRSDRAYSYSATIPGTALQPGELVYRVRLAAKDSVHWFPGGEPDTAARTSSGSRLEQPECCYTTTVFQATAPIPLIHGDERFNCDGPPGWNKSVVQGLAGVCAQLWTAAQLRELAYGAG